jgi:cytoplasmic tRNA 2-thiolation protein 2
MAYASFVNGTRPPTYLLKNTVPICAPPRPAQHGIQEWKSRTSTRSYNDAPSSSSGHGRPPHLANATDHPQHQPEPSPSSHLAPHLCYACHTTLTSRSSRGNVKHTSNSKVVPLPLWVGASRSLASTPEDSLGEVWATHRMGDGEMKAAIGDLLLNDS